MGEIILAIFTALLGIITGILIKSIDEWYNRPRLKVVNDRPLISPEVIGHRLVIKNEGKKAAINCVGTISFDNLEAEDLITEGSSELVRFGKTIDKGFPKGEEPTKFHLTPETFAEVKDEKLCWSDIGNPAVININPLTVSGLDIYRVLRNTCHIYFPSEGGWHNIKMVLQPKEYRGRIIISAENTTPVELKFKLVPIEQDVLLSFNIISKSSWV